jgi:hypothetical protein
MKKIQHISIGLKEFLMKKMTSFITLAGVLGMAMAFQVSAEMKNMQPMEQKMEQQMEHKMESMKDAKPMMDNKMDKMKEGKSMKHDMKKKMKSDKKMMENNMEQGMKENEPMKPKM